MGSLIGSTNKSGSYQQSAGQGTSASTQQSTSTSVGNSSSSSFSKAGLSADEVLAGWQAGKQSTDQWSKSSALGDVNGVLKQQATDALQSVMPTIAKTETGSGAYNSTTKELLTNDANARITGQLDKTALDAITSYGALGNQTTANNNQLLANLSGVAKDTGSSGSQASSTQTSNSSSSGQSVSQYDQNSEGTSSSKGGSGILGIFNAFADGGEVGTAQGSYQALKIFLDSSGLSQNIMEIQDMQAAAKKLMNGDTEGAASESSDSKDLQDLKEVGEIVSWFMADGGRVPLLKERMLHMADGGPIPKNTLTPEQELLEAIKKYSNGGAIRKGEADVRSGGKIKGEQSPTGEDNQVIAVAGGEGIIPKDVMDVPGVPEMLKGLIAKYHTPVNAAK